MLATIDVYADHREYGSVLTRQSSEPELSLQLRQESGPPLRQLGMARRQSKFREFLNLPPGSYVLVETNHLSIGIGMPTLSTIR